MSFPLQSDYPFVTIIIPTYQEAENISLLIDRVSCAIGHSGEIVVVDDDSPDETWRTAQCLAGGNGRLRVIRRIGRRGLASAIQEGIDGARGELIGWMDCDLSMPPEKLPALIDSVRNGADIAVGSRYVESGADLRREKLPVILSRIISFICRLTLNPKFHDYTSGFVVAKRGVLSEIRLRGDYGEYFIDLIRRAEQRGFHVVEVPYHLTSRRAGVSKTSINPLGFFTRGIKYLATVARLRIWS